MIVATNWMISCFRCIKLLNLLNRAVFAREMLDTMDAYARMCEHIVEGHLDRLPCLHPACVTCRDYSMVDADRITAVRKGPGGLGLVTDFWRDELLHRAGHLLELEE